MSKASFAGTLFLLATLLSATTRAEIAFCHLLTPTGEPLKLLNLETEVKVEGPYAEITYHQTFKNPYDEPIETEYYFPRSDESVFHEFKATFNGRTIVGEIKEKEEAKKSYEDHKAKGDAVAYSEINVDNPDIMKIQVGNIPPESEVRITYSILQPIEIALNKLYKLTLPSTLTTRFKPKGTQGHDTPDIRNVPSESSKIEDWKIMINIYQNTPFTYINNPTHHLEPEMVESKQLHDPIYIATYSASIPLNKDFVVYWGNDEIHKPLQILAQHPKNPNDHMAFFSMFPQLNNLKVSEAGQLLNNEDYEKAIQQMEEEIYSQDFKEAKGEFIFVIDRSGSMGGNRIVNLRKALKSFIELLPEDSYFNVINYGSYTSLYRPDSIKLNDHEKKTFLKYIDTINSDMGGTNILQPVEESFELPLKQGYPRSVILMTDGDAYNADEIIDVVKKNSHKAKLCSIGIGHGSSQYLIPNIAKAGECVHEFVKDNEDLGQKTAYILKSAVSQSLQDIKFRMRCYGEEEGKDIFEYEDEYGFLLKNHLFKKFVPLPNTKDFKSCEAFLSYKSSIDGKTYNNAFNISDFDNAEVTDIWHKLGYSTVIDDYEQKIKANYNQEDKDEFKKKVIDYSIKYQVLSEYTSFLTVIKEGAVEEPTDKKILIENVQTADYEMGGNMQVRRKVAAPRERARAGGMPNMQATGSIPQAMAFGGGAQANFKMASFDGAVPEFADLAMETLAMPAPDIDEIEFDDAGDNNLNENIELDTIENKRLKKEDWSAAEPQFFDPTYRHSLYDVVEFKKSAGGVCDASRSFTIESSQIRFDLFSKTFKYGDLKGKFAEEPYVCFNVKIENHNQEKFWTVGRIFFEDPAAQDDDEIQVLITEILKNNPYPDLYMVQIKNLRTSFVKIFRASGYNLLAEFEGKDQSKAHYQRLSSIEGVWEDYECKFQKIIRRAEEDLYDPPVGKFKKTRVVQEKTGVSPIRIREDELDYYHVVYQKFRIGDFRDSHLGEKFWVPIHYVVGENKIDTYSRIQFYDQNASSDDEIDVAIAQIQGANDRVKLVLGNKNTGFLEKFIIDLPKNGKSVDSEDL